MMALLSAPIILFPKNIGDPIYIFSSISLTLYLLFYYLGTGGLSESKRDRLKGILDRAFHKDGIPSINLTLTHVWLH
jgi:hypothetical protein